MSTFSSQLSSSECNFLRKSELVQDKRTKKGKGRPHIIIVIKKDTSIKEVTKSLT